MEYSIIIENLVKKFGDFTAVNNISLKIEKGEFFGFLGPNGAGKTTTINIIMGLLDPTSGRVIVEGMNTSRDIERIRQIIGLVTQETIVEPELTVMENLRLFGRLYHVPEDEIEERGRNLLKMVGLENFSDAYAGVLSGGMQRRLAVAKALIHNPKILILDEPTTGLDVQNRTNFWNLLEKVNRERGITILLTTQYLEEADRLCQRIAIIDHGKIVALGTPSELKRSISRGSILEISAEKGALVQAAEIAKKLFRQEPKIQGDRFSVAVEGDSIEAMNKYIKELEAKKVTIISVSMHQPTLDDVFLKLTGSSLRDTVSSEAPSRMALMRRR
ncbi:MAG: ATP-binding cassette domain-containing protein [Candidatus Micrarchaeia archaeon]|jgi:ABC-2 type transport system ATP-binding protein